MKKEIRTLQAPAKVEIREDGGIGKIYGYAAMFNKDSEDLGFIEHIAPGAFKNALKKSDIRGLKNHDENLIFAREGVNLKIVEDEKGLYYEAAPIDTQNFRETANEIRMKLLTGQSFGFNVKTDEWSGLDTDKPKRRITEFLAIRDVGPVTFPAYPDTEVALRSMEAAKQTEPSPMKLISEDAPVEIKIGESIRIYSGENRIEDAIKDLRSLSKPTLPDNENPDPPPTRIEDKDGKDDTLKRIDELIEKFKE